MQNDRLLQIIDKKTSLLQAFGIVDDVLRNAIKGISELVTVPGLINVDFADVKSIMKDQGTALMGMGTATGDNRAIEAAKSAISSPLLELSMDGANGVLFIVSGGDDLSMHEVNEAAKIITSSADTDAKIIFGANVDKELGNEFKITVIATGFEDNPLKRKEVTQKTVSSAPEQDTYTPNQFLANDKNEDGLAETIPDKEDNKDDKDDKKDDDYKMPPPPKPKAKDDDDNDEEDLDIPAFIRKKMM